jgi:hypothetical protein
MRGCDVEARPRIRFKTNIRVMQFDLGDYFAFMWTRGQVSAARTRRRGFRLKRLQLETWRRAQSALHVRALPRSASQAR